MTFALNEDDDEYRRHLLADVAADEIIVTIDGRVIAEGRDALDGRISALLTDPISHVRLRSSHRSGRDTWGTWHIRGQDHTPRDHKVRAHSDGSGRLLTVDAYSSHVDDAPTSLRARAVSAITGNPLALIGLIGGTVYLALRLPLGVFYGTLGVPPDDIGFGPEVLVPQSVTLFVAFVIFLTGFFVGSQLVPPTVDLLNGSIRLTRLGYSRGWLILIGSFLYGALIAMALAMAALLRSILDLSEPTYAVRMEQVFFAVGGALIWATVMYPIARLMRKPSAALRAQIDALTTRRRRSRQFERDVAQFSALAAGYTMVLLLLVLPGWALSDAKSVRDGGVAGGRITPWRALPVSLHWTKASHVALTNDCKVLRLLGTGNGQLVLYDTKLDKLFRVPVADASAAVDRDCA